MTSIDLSSLTRATLVVLLLIGIALLAVPLAPIFLLIFAAVLIAVLIRSAAWPFAKLGLGNNASVLLGLLAILVLLGAFGWLFGAEMSGQFVTLQQQLMAAIPRMREAIDGTPVLGDLADATPDIQNFAMRAAGFAFGLIGVVTNLVLVFVGAAYLALDPHVYKRGLAKLFPRDRSDKVLEALDASGGALQRYLLGQLATMTIVGLMVWAGLSLVGVESAAALGLTIALANFIPLVGPFIGAIPGLIIAFAQGGDTLLWAALVYLVAQQLEGNVLTPIVQQRAVSIPPALLIFALAALGALFGLAGVILAAPITVVIYTLVTMLWTRDTLGHDVHIPGRGKESAERSPEQA